MGLDVYMAVGLKIGTTPAVLNKRFRERHQCSDTLVPTNEYLILDERVAIHNMVKEDVYAVNSNLARFYGLGYERGPALKIILQLEWLRAQPEVEAVYYSSDCADEPSLWTKHDSLRLLDHFFKFGNTPYANWCKGTWEDDNG